MTEHEPLEVLTVAQVLANETPEDPEVAYRRGYCDGWIEAANTLTDQQLYDKLFDHWEKELAAWRREKPPLRRFEFPPRLAGMNDGSN